MGYGSGVGVSCGVGCRHGSDPVLLWSRPVAIASIQLLAWELSHAVGVTLKRPRKKKKKKLNIKPSLISVKGAKGSTIVNHRGNVNFNPVLSQN